MSKNNYELYESESVGQTKELHTAQSLMVELLLMAGVVGTLFCFLSDNGARAILLGVGILGVIYLNLITRWKPNSDLLRMLPSAVGVLVLLVNPLGASRGFLYFCNQCIDLWDRRFNQLVPKLSVSGGSVFSRMQVFIFLLLVVCVWIHGQVKARHLLGISCLVMGLLLFTAVFQMNMSLTGILALIAGWILAWLLTASIHFWTVKQLPFLVLGVVLVALLGIPLGSYSGTAFVEDLKEKICEDVNGVRYGGQTLPNGDMQKADTLVGLKTDEALRLTTKEANEVYLKGFVGGQFDGTAWKVLPYADYSSEEIAMTQWLSSQTFQTSFQYGNYEKYTGEDQTKETVSTQVENVGADRRYLYLPYEVDQITSGSGSMYRDYQVKAKGVFGEKSYGYDSYTEDQPTETMVQKQIDSSISGADAYAQQENVYLSYAKDNYTTLTEEQKSELDQIFFSQGDWSNASLYQITEQIRIVLQGKTSYTDQPRNYGGRSEFISWFFNQAKSGNSAYYATVATLAYRAAGIPARYVEGYYLNATDAANYKAANQSDITLTQADAHAWTEVYLDGMGWMPVEVVPGFYFAEYTTQQIVGTPQSSVNIVNQTDQQEMQGSTSDSLDSIDEKKPTKEQTVKKVIQVVGILLLAAIILWLLQFLVLTRYRILRDIREKKFANANHQDASRMRYRNVCKVLKSAGLPVKEDFPYENIPLILEKYPQMEEYECKRFAQLLQKVVFGQQELNDAEYKTVQVFHEKITDTVYQGLDRKKKWWMKYGRAWC